MINSVCGFSYKCTIPNAYLKILAENFFAMAKNGQMSAVGIVHPRTPESASSMLVMTSADKATTTKSEYITSYVKKHPTPDRAINYASKEANRKSEGSGH